MSNDVNSLHIMVTVTDTDMTKYFKANIKFDNIHGNFIRDLQFEILYRLIATKHFYSKLIKNTFKLLIPLQPPDNIEHTFWNV